MTKDIKYLSPSANAAVDPVGYKTIAIDKSIENHSFIEYKNRIRNLKNSASLVRGENNEY